jgi:hypothetical protein
LKWSLSFLQKGKNSRLAGVVGALTLVVALSAWHSQARAPQAASEKPGTESKPARTAPSSKRPPHREIEERADELLRQACALLASTPRFSFEAEETFDEVFDHAPRLQLTNVRHLLVDKPGRMTAQAEGDTLYRAVWFDGRHISALNKEENVYTTLDQPPTLDAALDLLETKYKVDVPLTDFVYSDPYAVLSEGLLYGEYLGIHEAAGVDCHHLAFSQASIDWQLWIDAGEKPLPRKLVISYRDEPGVPQYFAVIRKWDLDPTISEGAFRFEPPQGATRVDPAMFRREHKTAAKSNEAGQQQPVSKGVKP